MRSAGSRAPDWEVRPLNSIDIWISRLAVVCGALTLALPLLSVLRARNAPRGRTSGHQTHLLRWPLIFAYTIAIIAVGVLLWKPIPAILDARLRVIFSLIGAILYFPGLAMYLWGFFTLGSMFGVSSSMGAELYEKHRLVESGPFRYVRHPMYSGVILTAFGALFIFRTWTMLVFAPLMLVVAFRARREEILLASEFGERWEAYTKRVPAWIPRIRPRR